MSFQEVLKFWFKEIEASLWWAKDKGFDDLIKQRFAQVHNAAIQCLLYQWRDCAEGRLAEIIVLDQFSRNIYRDSIEAFAYDSQALVLAQEAVAQGHDKSLTSEQREFLYLPYMHSESAEIHQLAVALYQSNKSQRPLEFELKHKKIIDQFGRYPHRNDILGRSSTAAELEFLKGENSSF